MMKHMKIYIRNEKPEKLHPTSVAVTDYQDKRVIDGAYNEEEMNLVL